MPASPLSRRLGAAAAHTPGLRKLPVVRLLLLGEVLLIARNHFEVLTPKERRRLVVLVRDTHGRPRKNLNERERQELQELIAKVDPKLFAQEAAEKLSPVRLPKRFRPSA